VIQYIFYQLSTGDTRHQAVETQREDNPQAKSHSAVPTASVFLKMNNLACVETSYGDNAYDALFNAVRRALGRNDLELRWFQTGLTFRKGICMGKSRVVVGINGSSRIGSYMDPDPYRAFMIALVDAINAISI